MENKITFKIEKQYKNHIMWTKVYICTVDLKKAETK